MTPPDLERIAFSRDAVDRWSRSDPRRTNWPVVYLLDDEPPAHRPRRTRVYVGESLNAGVRLKQHLSAPSKQGLERIRVVFDETFNKSVCLDLEAYLIQLLSGDPDYEVQNLNGGIADADYFDRQRYRDRFTDLCQALHDDGLFSRSIPEIENGNLFKLSPFKSLTHDQAIAVEDILEGLFTDLAARRPSTVVVQGEPGTGKTVVAIYLIKLLRDIQTVVPDDLLDPDWMFAEYFTAEHRQLLAGFRIGLVVPQQSLRASIEHVFRKTPHLDHRMVLSPFDVGADTTGYDLLVVDEAHRLNQRASLASGVQNKQFADITRTLFGSDDLEKTQLDWITARSRHQVLLADPEQSVRPADLPRELLDARIDSARDAGRWYRLATQLRVRAGSDYVGWVRGLLRSGPSVPPSADMFGDYDLRMYDDFREMRDQIRDRNAAEGLARLVAGYAWPWRSRDDTAVHDIELDGCRVQWNRTQTDWIDSATSLDEMGSIHTVQGYDLNYAGVVIGPELRYDPARGRTYVDRASYYDAKGKQNNRMRGVTYSDDDLREYVLNIYGVLLTRGIRGTYVYVCDPALREHLRPYLSGRDGGTSGTG